MYKLILAIFLALTFQYARSQNIKAYGKVKSTQQFSFPKDTILTDYKYRSEIQINWMDSIIVVNKTDRIKYDLEEARKFRRDSSYVPSPSDTVLMNEMRMTGSQNCHSYALEKYFNSHQIENPLFTKWTYLKENSYMNSILSTAFLKTKSFETKRRKCKECLFDKGSLVVFRNQWDSPSHTVYFDGQFFHSKYGALPAKAERKVEEILKIYWDSIKIEEYQLNEDKILNYMERRKNEVGND